MFVTPCKHEIVYVDFIFFVLSLSLQEFIILIIIYAICQKLSYPILSLINLNSSILIICYRSFIKDIKYDCFDENDSLIIFVT